ncbi:unnamed protein product [Heligmosomoides polygyrus]|uniref:Uncharacterized protein n=1 Tax=Heligmosomoides polygyrus TaxID=6339 RepID=A0A183FRU4_HELPZ|nr:unnamed protein product [Heligmosomoides polygyrus]
MDMCQVKREYEFRGETGQVRWRRGGVEHGASPSRSSTRGAAAKAGWLRMSGVCPNATGSGGLRTRLGRGDLPLKGIPDMADYSPTRWDSSRTAPNKSSLILMFNRTANRARQGSGRPSGLRNAWKLCI